MTQGRLGLYLALGRVSNLPTVATNTLAGAALGGALPGEPRTLVAGLALSLTYVAGMFLNDAFDREIDRRERPERPIPSGRISAREVFAVGFSLLGASVLLVAAVEGHPGPATGAAAVLAALVVLYDARHKQVAAAPWVMGACRGASLLVAALAAGGSAPPGLFLAALTLAAYVVGLTYVARGENGRRPRAGVGLLLLAAPGWLLLGGAVPSAAWGIAALLAGYVAIVVRPLLGARPADVGRAVGGLIAGISLVDSLVLARLDEPGLAVVAALAVPLTLALQRRVRGT